MEVRFGQSEVTRVYGSEMRFEHSEQFKYFRLKVTGIDVSFGQETQSSSVSLTNVSGMTVRFGQPIHSKYLRFTRVGGSEVMAE